MDNDLKKCLWCKNPFTPQAYKGFCSKECSNAWDYWNKLSPEKGHGIQWTPGATYCRDSKQDCSGCDNSRYGFNRGNCKMPLAVKILEKSA
jgi:hypothetical protein